MSPRLNQLPGQTGDSDKDPRPDNVVALTPVESTTRPVCNNNDDIAVLRDQVSALTETVKNLCDDIAGLSKALETRLSPRNDAAADGKVKVESEMSRGKR